MLLFILLPHLPHVFLRIISIHLMLLFILVLPQGSPFVLHFNTSHVTVYHGAQSNIVSIHADFNTSHVTVYRLFNIFSIASSSFQYISCYCLSITEKEMIHTSINFNTSHVTVYLPANTPSSYLSSFQYISCYCLSVNSFCCVAVNLVFQYISCYCLSPVPFSCSFCHYNFNTSHVTVYLLVGRLCSSTFGDFNTSHVTVYRCNHTGSVLKQNISIHLMLLFIGKGCRT